MNDQEKRDEYLRYERLRLRGFSHDAVKGIFPDTAEALRAKFVENMNAGARAADDERCRKCGLRTCGCAAEEQREQREFRK